MGFAIDNRIRLALYGGLAVVAFDAIMSVASRLLDFQYTDALLGSLVLYGTVGFFAWRLAGFSFATQMGAWLGFADATLGWVVSVALAANVPPGPEIGPVLWVAVAVYVMSTATISSLLGAAIARISHRSSAAPS